jgi:hypothetical protein
MCVNLSIGARSTVTDNLPLLLAFLEKQSQKNKLSLM